jgi:transforming growth factor-beta-induced protein
MKSRALVILSVVLLLSMSIFAGVSAQETNDNIVDIVAKNDDFSILHTAIVAAGLADTLASADNTFTVFAPPNSAFAAVEAAYPGTLAALLADPQGALTDILLYHVANGRLMSGDVLASTSVPTLFGEDLAVSLRSDEPYVNDSKITAVDIPAKNGVIHVIDSVLVPEEIAAALVAAAAEAPEVEEAEEAEAVEETETAETVAPPAPAAPPSELKTIAEIAVEAGQFTTLVSLLDQAGLVSTFAQPGNYTVFAPTDEAFAALGDVNLTASEIEAILLYHVVNDTLVRDQIATDDLIPTLSGGRPLFVNRDGPTVIDISGAQVLVWDIMASNGIIHVIDSVMIP